MRSLSPTLLLAAAQNQMLRGVRHRYHLGCCTALHMRDGLIVDFRAKRPPHSCPENNHCEVTIPLQFVRCFGRKRRRAEDLCETEIIRKAEVLLTDGRQFARTNGANNCEQKWGRGESR